MCSLKKTMLNILIGIAAAAGVATADDTSASSVSLSLSLTNVVTSNKAGKQPKAGKQVKAAVGKAVKAKAVKADNSLSSIMSMSYGPDPDDDDPDYNPGLQNLPPDQKAIKAGLKFPVSLFLEALQTQYSDSGYIFTDPFTVHITATAESFTTFILNVAGIRALGKGGPSIVFDDIRYAVESDDDLTRVLDAEIVNDVVPSFLREDIVNSGVYQVFLESNTERGLNISVKSMFAMYQIVVYTVQGITDRAIQLAIERGTYDLTAELARRAFQRWIDLERVSTDSPIAFAIEEADLAVERFLASS